MYADVGQSVYGTVDEYELMDNADLNAMIFALAPALGKRNYAGNLHDAWFLKNEMPVSAYLTGLPLHYVNDPQQLAKQFTLAYIEWKGKA